MTAPDLIRSVEAGERIFTAVDTALIAIELARCLRASTDALVLDRDALYESVTTDDGTYMDPDDERQVREYDELIEANRAALARAYGNREGAA